MKRQVNADAGLRSYHTYLNNEHTMVGCHHHAGLSRVCCRHGSPNLYALLRHQSPPPSAPPSASAGQRAGAGPVSGKTLALSCWGPRLRCSRDRSIHQTLCQRRRRAASPTLRVPVSRGMLMLLLLLRPRSPPPSPRAPRDPAAIEPGAAPLKAQGPRHRARPLAQPRRWGSAQRAGAGRGDGVLTPSPSPVPARDRREPPLPRACLSAQAHETRRGSHWNQPRPRAEYLQTPSPARAADYGRLLRMRDAGQGACAFHGVVRS